MGVNDWLEAKIEDKAREALRFGAAHTCFLDPAQQLLARRVAQRLPEAALLFDGGYPGAERCVARFVPAGETHASSPVVALELSWHAKFAPAPSHRDLLGAAMGLGLERDRVGDILPGPERAYLFTLDQVADFLQANLDAAGHTKLRVARCQGVPELPDEEAHTARGTVAAPRLDAVLAEALNISRSQALQLVRGERVKRNHLPESRPDRAVAPGDLLSVQGRGRIRVVEIAPTRKGRFAITFARLL